MSDPNDAFLDSLVADLKPVTPLRQRRGMAGATGALGLGVLLVASLLGTRPYMLGEPPASLALTAAGVFLVLALASAWAVVGMARPAVGLRREGWGWTALMAAVLPASAIALVVADVASGRPVGLDRGGLGCLGLGCMVGVLTGATLVLWLRRGAPSSVVQAGTLTGVAAGAAGIFAVSLWCAHDGLLHIGIWHGGTVLLTGIIGRIAVPPLVRW